MGSHIAFFNGPMVGHVYPTLPVVAELVRRGHRVSYATTASRAAEVAATGAAVVGYRTTRPADTDPGVRPPDRSTYIGDMLLRFVVEAEAAAPQLLPAFEHDRPDLVVYDRVAFTGRLFAQRYAIPMVQLWPMLISTERWSLRHVQDDFDPAHPSFRSYLERLETLLATHRLSMGPEEFLNPGDARHLAFYPRAFQYRGDELDDRYHFVGPCVAPRPFQPRWLPPDDRPVLLVALGTVFNRQPQFYRTCVAAFRDPAWRVVIAVGERMDPATVGPVPEHIEVHRTVAQLDVLGHARAFLSHAGMGGTMEALRQEVPLATVPLTLEQEANADRVAQLGLGVRLRMSELTPTALRAEIERLVADTRSAGRLRWMRDEIAAAGGTARAADLIETQLA